MNKMKIISVIVDKIPQNCDFCIFPTFATDGKRIFTFCQARDEMINRIKYAEERPENCPLHEAETGITSNNEQQL